MALPTVRVRLDGVPVVVELAQGDYIRAERDGHRFGPNDPQSSAGNVSVIFHGLRRAKRRGLIDVEIPEDFEDFLDVFDWDGQDEEPEFPEGKDSSQETPTG